MENSTASTESLPVHALVTHYFNTKPDRLFDAWLDPVMIGQFMFGPRVRDEEIVKLENEPYIGGSFTYSVKRKGIQLDHQGEYLEIDRPNCLVFTWSVKQEMNSHSRIVIEIYPKDHGSQLTLTQEMSAKWADFVHDSKIAWSIMLDKLQKALE